MKDSEKQQFLDAYAPYAMKEQQRTGIPASITLAQMALESSWGKSEPATKSNNYFGIKAHGDYEKQGRVDYYNDDRSHEKFCRYQSVEESIADHSRVLMSEKYQNCRRFSETDYQHWAEEIKAAGYATDNNYVNKLTDIIEQHHLYEYDRTAKELKAQGVNITPEAQSQMATSYVVKYKEGGFSFPMDLNGKDSIRISSDYGWRKPPVSGASSNHRGIDIPMNVGTPLLATEDNGRIVQIKNNAGAAGNYIRVSYDRDDGKSFVVTYMHLKEIGKNLKEGDKVMAGQQLGLSGNTGASSGPHLHMDVRFGDTPQGKDVSNMTFIDPKIYMSELAIRQNSSVRMEKNSNGNDLLAQYRDQMTLEEIPKQDVSTIDVTQFPSQEAGTPRNILELIALVKKNQMLGDIGGSSDVIADLVGAVFQAGIAMTSLFSVAGSQEQEKEERADAALDPDTVRERHREGLENLNIKQMSNNNFEAECPEQTQGRTLDQR